MTKLEGMTNNQMTNDRNGTSSSFVLCYFPHIQLRKEKGVDVRRLFDALAQGGADAMPSAGAGPQ